MSQPAANTSRFGAALTTTSPTVPTRAPAVITSLGPRWSSHRPTRMPESAETMSPPEKASVIAGSVHPVSSAIAGAPDDQGVVEDAPADDLSDRKRSEPGTEWRCMAGLYGDRDAVTSSSCESWPSAPGTQLVVRRGAALAARQEAGLHEDLQVVRHGRLAEADRLDEVADAGFPHRRMPRRSTRGEVASGRRGP